jgi:predicted RecB family nuclease
MYSATDIANFVACPHIATLKKAEKAGKLKRPYYNDPGTQLLRQLGNEHEQAFLKHLRDVEKRDVVLISRDSRITTVAQTLTAMRQGAEVIYQAALIDEPWRGFADFLIRVDQPSELGFFSYEAVDTKLARSPRITALIQLCFYSELVAKIQGRDPELMHLVLGGDGGQESFPYKKYAAYFRHVRRSYTTAIDENPETYPEPVEHCRVCDWSTHCAAQRRSDDHLSLVAGITTRQRKSLTSVGIATVTGLAAIDLPADPPIEEISESSLTTIWNQARIQVEGRKSGKVIYELFEDFEPNKGLAALPLPSKGDLFLDFEADPFACTTGLEYLIGIASRDEQDMEVYDAKWAFDRTEEKKAFEWLIARIMQGLKRDPGMHVYHYAPYEVGAIKRLANLHATCTDEVDDLLRKGVFVDLYRVVRQSLRASVESYSIKRLEPLFGYIREVPLEEANASLSAFTVVLITKEGRDVSDDLRRTIQGYNRDDCISAWRLRDWLEELRLKWREKFGGELPRLTIEVKEGTDDKLSEYVKRVRALETRLLEGIPEEPENQTPAQKATWLLAKSLEWHRRDEKATWWEYYRQLDLTPEERVQDGSALEGLVYEGPVGAIMRSTIHRYRFPPQEFKLSLGKKPRDPNTRSEAGEIVAIDEDSLTIDLKRGNGTRAPHPTALIPFELFTSTAQRESLLRIGEWVAEKGIETPGPYQAARDILLRRNPSGEGRSPLAISRDSETLNAAAVRLVTELCDSTLPVQGPPGSGKTFNGARMALELVRNQKRVGITAPSHKVISNLLSSITKAACEDGVKIAIVQRADKDHEDRCVDDMIEAAENNDLVLAKLESGAAQIAAGTSWLWSPEKMANKVDVLFVDEAGQMSLANVLAVSQAASSVVLLGDPQQLDQPQKGVHPEGTGVSALTHLLAGRATIATDQGLFLRDTWRLHPDVCDFISEQFYDSKLMPQAENWHQRLNTKGSLDGTGLRLIAVEHFQNSSESTEEVEKVVELVGSLLQNRSTWTDREGVEHELTLEDILIVAAYNAQVDLLRKSLPEARIGTVDKFQGQEAPVVIYSMAASSAEDAPRGMNFLYSLNRLNVAISRARCVAVIVASPLLFNAQCRTPRQAELANAFCRFLELAKAT